ncbi:thioredoxin-related transmembrane protein 1 [Phlebotomus argentipes]|uniref:thioredoxin-related transmembrane protein 1 n=1 Tax=Phlebotomus argentipes TaxID=94469 RepID=UPI002892D743|nr:thioredoxin-related transmembrane protein 1 [Phlebotomus argentipes]
MSRRPLLVCVAVFLAIALPNGQCAERLPNVVELSESNWDLMLKGEWMVEFYAPWCPACKNIEHTWEEFSAWTQEVNVKTAKIDVTASPGLSGRFFVTALPTIFHVKNGEFRQYRGGRDINALMTFIQERKWKNVEPVSAWKKPDSIQMSIVSYFFKLSHFLKELNTLMLKEYGLPAWASYAIFAVATILMGAILGLLLVCVIDCLFPPKHLQRTSFSDSQRGDHGSGDDIRADELEDEEVSSGSDKEKYSGTDTEDEEEEEEDGEKVSPPPSPRKATPKASPTSSPDVRKRKARKAE